MKIRDHTFLLLAGLVALWAVLAFVSYPVVSFADRTASFAVTVTVCYLFGRAFEITPKKRKYEKRI